MKALLKITPARQVNEAIRVRIMSLACSIDSWVDEHFVNQPQITETNWVDELRWWLQSGCSSLFAWACDGSAAEITSVFNGEIPIYAWNERQAAVFRETCLSHDLNPVMSCCQCRWRARFFDGPAFAPAQPQLGYDDIPFSPLISDKCPECRGAVYLEDIVN